MRDGRPLAEQEHAGGDRDNGIRCGRGHDHGRVCLLCPEVEGDVAERVEHACRGDGEQGDRGSRKTQLSEPGGRRDDEAGGCDPCVQHR